MISVQKYGIAKKVTALVRVIQGGHVLVGSHSRATG